MSTAVWTMSSSTDESGAGPQESSSLAPRADNSDVWVIVPTYNEAAVVRDVIRGLGQFFPQVVAVDDCSTDASAQEIRAAGARLVSHPINMGAGGALQTGVDFALLDPAASYFVMFDADGQHRPEDAAAMVDRLRSDEMDVLVGSRFLGAANNITRSRRFVLSAARWFEYATTGAKLTDAHNGLRVFNRAFAEVLQMRNPGMAWATEFIERAVREKMRLQEFPVTIDYTEYSRGKGQHSINSVNIGVDILLDRFLRGPR